MGIEEVRGNTRIQQGNKNNTFAKSTNNSSSAKKKESVFTAKSPVTSSAGGRKDVSSAKPKVTPKTQYKVSKDRLDALNTLIKAGKSARADFDKQLAQDGWAGDLADGISALWGSKNRASKVRKDLQSYNKNMSDLKKAAQQGDAQFNTKFQQIYGVKYNQSAIDKYKKNPTDANYKLAFGTKQQNIKSRVAAYNKSQQTGAQALKVGATIVGTGVVAAATGGTGLVAMAAIAGGTTVAIEESDRAHVTGQHKDSSGKTVKDKGVFREGTDHKKILKKGAMAAGAVLAGGAVARVAQAAVPGSILTETATGELATTLSTGDKIARVAITATGDTAVGAAQEYIETGTVTAQGVMINATLSAALGSATEFGITDKVIGSAKKGLTKARDGVKRGFGQVKDKVYSKFKLTGSKQASAVTAVASESLGNPSVISQSIEASTSGGKKTYVSPQTKKVSIELQDDVMASNSGIEIVGTPKKRRFVIGDESPKPQSSSSQTVEYGGRTFKKATPKSRATSEPGIEIVNRPRQQSTDAGIEIVNRSSAVPQTRRVPSQPATPSQVTQNPVTPKPSDADFGVVGDIVLEGTAAKSAPSAAKGTASSSSGTSVAASAKHSSQNSSVTATQKAKVSTNIPRTKISFNDEIKEIRREMSELTKHIMDMEDLLRHAKLNNGSVVTRYGAVAYVEDLEQGISMLKSEYKSKHSEIQSLIELGRKMNQ